MRPRTGASLTRRRTGPGETMPGVMRLGVPSRLPRWQAFEGRRPRVTPSWAAHTSSFSQTRGATVMDISIEERPIGQVTVLDIVGKLTMDQAAQRLKDKINSLVAQERTQIVLN